MASPSIKGTRILTGRAQKQGFTASVPYLLREEGNRLLIFESDSVREVTLDDSDLVILGEDNHRRYKPEPLQSNDVAGDLPCLTTLKSWRSEGCRIVSERT